MHGDDRVRLFTCSYVRVCLFIYLHVHMYVRLFVSACECIMTWLVDTLPC